MELICLDQNATESENHPNDSTSPSTPSTDVPVKARPESTQSSSSNPPRDDL